MDDLISRKAAIESIRECAETAHDNYEWDMEQGYLNAIECVEEEPSAQPEQHLCRDCKWAKYYGNVDKNGNVESYWYCTNWYGGTDEEGYCHEWESR